MLKKNYESPPQPGLGVAGSQSTVRAKTAAGRRTRDPDVGRS